MDKSVLLGAGVGAATGTGIGIAIEQSAGSALIGAGVGAVVGATMGYLGHKDQEKKNLLLKAAGKHRDISKDLPYLKAPQASCRKADERIEGSTYFGAHIICEIERPAVWAR